MLKRVKKAESGPGAAVHCPWEERHRWPANYDSLIKRSALEHILMHFDIDYEKVADIIEPHVVPGGIVSLSLIHI